MAEKHTHTPGPWTYKHNDICGPDDTDGDDLVLAAVGVSYGLRSSTYSIVRNCPEMEANARLIAQAPAMLRALQKAENNMILMYSGIAGGDAEAGQRFADKDPVVAVVRSVIAAASGEAP